jgi:hypothetical protein
MDISIAVKMRISQDEDGFPGRFLGSSQKGYIDIEDACDARWRPEARTKRRRRR